MLDLTQIQKILAHVAGSYLAREMDRRWIDGLLANSQIGARLRELTPSQLRGLEVVMYTLVAYTSHTRTSPSALRTMLQLVLSDLPVETVKRLMDAHSGTPKDVRAALDAMSDDELMSLYQEIGRRMRPSNQNGSASGITAQPIATNSVQDSDGARTGGKEKEAPPHSGQSTQHQHSAIRECADGVAAWRENLRKRFVTEP